MTHKYEVGDFVVVNNSATYRITKSGSMGFIVGHVTYGGVRYRVKFILTTGTPELGTFTLNEEHLDLEYQLPILFG